ncbi:uncharacterized protein LOC113300595 [Papaver somniferum]|uniref:uncharacterized protein LOC113300595 n=1 Tax=Papaver somniferum TaxID=3469 RepID=UPI000E704B26|nr:uncharacterized protein LOC113300595 [Papaver somniferum]
MGRAVIEMYRNMKKLERKIFWDDMRPIVFPHTSENVQEPDKGKGKGMSIPPRSTKKIRRKGRNIIQKGESSERNMKKKGPMLRSQPTPSEPSQVKKKEIHDTTAHVDKRYLEELPPYIRDYVISINDVPPDGNCGFHVVKEQLGPFTQGA